VAGNGPNAQEADGQKYDWDGCGSFSLTGVFDADRDDALLTGSPKARLRLTVLDLSLVQIVSGGQRCAKSEDREFHLVRLLP
jgi:hypothetical protein